MANQEASSVTTKPRRDTKQKFETHVYLTAKEKQAVQHRAKEESRSVTGQILHYIKRGIHADEKND